MPRISKVVTKISTRMEVELPLPLKLQPYMNVCLICQNFSAVDSQLWIILFAGRSCGEYLMFVFWMNYFDLTLCLLRLSLRFSVSYFETWIAAWIKCKRVMIYHDTIATGRSNLTDNLQNFIFCFWDANFMQP